MSAVTVELPEQTLECLQAQRPDLPRFLLEAVALEGYRQELLSRGQVSEMLGLNFWETEAFLKEHKAYLHYDIHDLEQDVENINRVLDRQRVAA